MLRIWISVVFFAVTYISQKALPYFSLEEWRFVFSIFIDSFDLSLKTLQDHLNIKKKIKFIFNIGKDVP